MGVQARIVVHGAGEAEACDAARAAFARIAALEAVLSDYREDSEIEALALAAGGPARPVSEDLARVLGRALEVHRMSGGAFDVTVGPIVRLWREARRAGVLPRAEDLARARALAGVALLDFDAAARTLRLARPGMHLDFGGIGKGFAAGEALALLAGRGLPHALVDVGGDLALGLPPPGRDSWIIDAGPGAPPLRLGPGGVATSGDTELFLERDGVRYSHLVDPATGIGLTDRALVTVIAGDAALADALASAVSVLGPERGILLVDGIDGTAARIEARRGPGRIIVESARWRTLSGLAPLRAGGG